MYIQYTHTRTHRQTHAPTNCIHLHPCLRLHLQKHVQMQIQMYTHITRSYFSMLPLHIYICIHTPYDIHTPTLRDRRSTCSCPCCRLLRASGGLWRRLQGPSSCRATWVSVVPGLLVGIHSVKLLLPLQWSSSAHMLDGDDRHSGRSIAICIFSLRSSQVGLSVFGGFHLWSWRSVGLERNIPEKFPETYHETYPETYPSVFQIVWMKLAASEGLE